MSEKFVARSNELVEQYEWGEAILAVVQKAIERRSVRMTDLFTNPFGEVPPADHQRIRSRKVKRYAEKHNLPEEYVWDALALAEALLTLERRYGKSAVATLLSPEAGLTYEQIIDEAEGRSPTDGEEEE